MTLAEKLEKIRRDRGLSKSQLAKAVGVGDSTLGAWINKGVKPSEPGHWAALERVCGVPLSVLMDDDADLGSAAGAKEAEAAGDAMEQIILEVARHPNIGKINVIAILRLAAEFGGDEVIRFLSRQAPIPPATPADGDGTSPPPSSPARRGNGFNSMPSLAPAL